MADETKSNEDAFVTCISAMLKGNAEPPDAHIAYLLKVYRDDSQAMMKMQEDIVKMQGRIQTREEDMRHWFAENKKATPDEPAEAAAGQPS